MYATSKFYMICVGKPPSYSSSVYVVYDYVITQSITIYPLVWCISKSNKFDVVFMLYYRCGFNDSVLSKLI